MAKVKLMWKWRVPTHGGIKDVYYTAPSTRQGERLGEYETVEDAIRATDRAYAGLTDDTMYDEKNRRVWRRGL